MWSKKQKEFALKLYNGSIFFEKKKLKIQSFLTSVYAALQIPSNSRYYDLWSLRRFNLNSLINIQANLHQ